MHPLPDPIIAPGAEVAPHRRPRRKLMRQGSPLATGTIQVQDGIDHFAHVSGARMPTGLGGWNERLEDGPFLLTEITWVASSFHLPTSSLVPFPGCSFLFPSSLILPLGTLPYRSPHQAPSSAFSRLCTQPLRGFTLQFLGIFPKGESSNESGKRAAVSASIPYGWRPSILARTGSKSTNQDLKRA